MQSEWKRILEEYLARVGLVAGHSERGRVADGLVHDEEAEQIARAALVLGRIRGWLVHDVLPASANAVFHLAVEEDLRGAPPWVRVRFSMQDRLDSFLDDSTLTFSVPEGVVVTVPDLRPCFDEADTPGALLPTEAEFPDLVELEQLRPEWVAAAVHRFVRAALARQ